MQTEKLVSFPSQQRSWGRAGCVDTGLAQEDLAGQVTGTSNSWAAWAHRGTLQSRKEEAVWKWLGRQCREWHPVTPIIRL